MSKSKKPTRKGPTRYRTPNTFRRKLKYRKPPRIKNRKITGKTNNKKRNLEK